MLFKKCPKCECIFGCIEMVGGEVVEKTCSECPENKVCIIHTTEDYKSLFDEYKEDIGDYYCENCIWLHNQKIQRLEGRKGE